MSSPSIPHACMVCKRLLEWNINRKKWQHQRPFPEYGDHEAIPAPAMEMDDVIYRCDFCSADEIRYVVHVQEFIFSRVICREGDWGACGLCGTFLIADNWRGLFLQAKKIDEERKNHRWSEASSTRMWSMYDGIRTNVDGPIRQLAPGEAP